MKIRIITLIAILMFCGLLQANDFNLCSDTVIDSETEHAYGPHGIPYSGEILCYRDNDQKTLKSKRTFDKGKPIGKHICYGVNNGKGSFINYSLTGVKKRGFFAPDNEKVKKYPYADHTTCNNEIPSTCTVEWACKKDDKYCFFKCQ